MNGKLQIQSTVKYMKIDWIMKDTDLDRLDNCIKKNCKNNKESKKDYFKK